MICTDRGRGPGSFPSWGRKKRSVVSSANSTKASNTSKNSSNEEAEEVHELLRVYLSREDIPSAESKAQTVSTSVGKGSPKVCVPQTSYYALVTSVTILTSMVTFAALIAAITYFRRAKSSVNSDESHLIMK